MRISDWSSDVCSSDLQEAIPLAHAECAGIGAGKIALRRRSRNSRAQSGISLLRVARPPVVGLVNRKITIGAARISHVEHDPRRVFTQRSEEHTSELQSLMRTSYAAFCLTKQNTK